MEGVPIQASLVVYLGHDRSCGPVMPRRGPGITHAHSALSLVFCAACSYLLIGLEDAILDHLEVSVMGYCFNSPIPVLGWVLVTTGVIVQLDGFWPQGKGGWGVSLFLFCFTWQVRSLPIQTPQGDCRCPGCLVFLILAVSPTAHARCDYVT